MTMGEIVTFYSYKGGAGRTFTLANVGALLATWGFRVLCVDWDIEAPGLHYYLREFVSNEPTGGGLMELIQRLEASGTTSWRDLVSRARVGSAGATMSAIFAGADQDNYLHRLGSLDWNRLYEKNEFGSHLEDVRQAWKAEYDFVFVDSRTGVSDSGGICTVQLPDILVSVIVPNQQSFDGTVSYIRAAISQRNRLPVDRAKLIVVPIVSRFESRVEYETTNKWLVACDNAFGSFYKEWVHRKVAPLDVLRRTRIPYIPYWSFGEPLPAIQAGTSDPEDIGFSLETLAALLAQRCGATDVLIENRDAFVASARNLVSKSAHEVEFALNPDPRCACVLVLDTSGSMTGEPIEKLNAAMGAFQKSLQEDPVARRRIEIAVLSYGYGQASKAQDFTPAADFVPPTLEAGGATPMGAAIRLAIQMVRSRKDLYKQHGIPYYRPWIVLLTDGSPTDEWETAARLLRAEEAEKSIAVFTVGIGAAADSNILSQMSSRPPTRLDSFDFTGFFAWLSTSQKSVASSRVGEQVPLPPLTWTTL